MVSVYELEAVIYTEVVFPFSFCFAEENRMKAVCLTKQIFWEHNFCVI